MYSQIYRTVYRTLKATLMLGSMVTVNFPAQAADGLKTINNPGGGQIVYGPLSGHPSLRVALGEVLRNVHGHFGDRPQIGKFFQTRGSNSVATFFTLQAKREGSRQIAGMVIVSASEGADTAAAVLYDDASHFGKTASEMIQTLNQAWQSDTASVTAPAHSSDSTREKAKVASPAPAKPLHTVAFPDNSGTIGLPEGWQITEASAGAVHASGPDREAINLGVITKTSTTREARRRRGWCAT